MESRIHGFRWNPGSVSVEPVSLESGIHDSDPKSRGLGSGIPGPPGFLYGDIG